MRAPRYALLLGLWALAAACLCRPRADDWLELGFRTPEQTFRTFQTGLCADLPDLEYRCLAAAFKRRAAREGPFSQLAYREYRSELLRTQPWLRLAAKAEIERVQELAEDRVRLVARVDTWFHDETFAVELVREDFYELWAAGRRAADDFSDWRRLAQIGEGEVTVSVPLPEGLEPAAIDELRAGREWKIDGLPARWDGGGGDA
jgi:hypothetical protein